YKDGIKVTDIVGSFQDLLPEPADRAEIVRLQAPDFRPAVIGFNLRDVLDKKAEAPGLQPFDTIRIFGRYEADAPKVSIYGEVLLKPGDVLTVSQLGGWGNIGGAITVNGEVLHPGRYGIQEGEKLSAILKRAGGFLPEAYPYGAVLERDQVREISAKNRDDLIRQLQLQGVQGDGTGRPEPVLIQRQRQQLIDKLKQIQPNGRLLIHISTDLQKWENSVGDIEVHSGDTLIIPKRPNFVLVAGQVFN